MFQIFDHENVKETLEKEPLVCFYSANGACGPSGMLLIVFQDGSSFGYNTLHGGDQALIKRIVEHVPETKGLLGCINKDYRPKRDTTISQMELVNIGLGNYGCIHRSLFQENIHYDLYAIASLIDGITDMKMRDMCALIDETFRKRSNR